MTVTCSPPRTTVVKWYPVQAESVDWLSGCQMPNGQGLLVWKSGSSIRCAVTASPRAWLDNNVVASGDIATALSGFTMRSCSTFASGGNVFFSVMCDDATHAYQRIYIADDPNNPPAGWSLYGTVQSFSPSANSLLDNAMSQAGIPYIDGSNWVYTGGVWNNVLGYRFARCGLWTSSDNGVTWTNRVDKGFYIVGGSYIDYIPPQIGEGGDGYVYWTAYGFNRHRVYRAATSNLHSWSDLSGTDVNGSSYANWGTLSGGVPFAINPNGNRTAEITNWTAANPFGSTYATHVSFSGHGEHHRVSAAGGDGCDLYLFDVNSVQRAAGGWTVGHIGFG